MMDLNKYTKSELVEIASWYGVELPSSMLKAEMIEKVEVLIDVHEDEKVDQSQEIQKSVRVRRIERQNKNE